MAELFLDLFIFIAYEYVLLYSLLSEPTKEKKYLFIYLFSKLEQQDCYLYFSLTFG